MEAPALSRLIESIYDCAIDPALWPSTLEEIAAVLNSPAGTLTVSDFITGTERGLVYVGISEHYQALYREHYHICDLFGHELILRPVDQPSTSEELVGEEELLQSRIYREWAAPQGFRYVLLTALIKSQARLAYIGLTRGVEGGPYDAEEQARMALLAPHVRRAITIADLIDHKTLERDSLAATLDALTVSVLVLGSDARLIYSNVAGDAALAREDVLLSRVGIVEPWDRTAWPVFRAMIAVAAGGTVTLARRGGGNAVVSALPLCGERRRSTAPRAARVALFVQDNPCGPHAIELLGRAYSLTGAELRVLLGLADDATPADIAKRYGIAPSTVRTHLKSLFAKTGAKRQKDLVKLLLAIPPVVAKPL
ncbi:helix-turn-helix transcriptional regulator [Methylobacterium longum]|uniref:LuxR C-terminal-related transcriptional regulator n=1 Tax=Methylobacterium longum TaxID=767694 RepID=A0ABT8AZX4_9HYPH|nr:LuxR C-terminal-related transcriptional regulator [Methylobacterium longum]MDN3575000.1 LuxR C-terminal-related transcriptional regulator [Methylobacterium longum]